MQFCIGLPQSVSVSAIFSSSSHTAPRAIGGARCGDGVQAPATPRRGRPVLLRRHRCHNNTHEPARSRICNNKAGRCCVPRHVSYRCSLVAATGALSGNMWSGRCVRRGSCFRLWQRLDRKHGFLHVRGQPELQLLRSKCRLLSRRLLHRRAAAGPHTGWQPIRMHGDVYPVHIDVAFAAH